MMTGAGHNRGPSMDDGASWRRFCWTKARADLLPILPIEVVRGRVRRARELGLDYKTYAGVRATTGHDVVAFLFSSNALRLPAPALSADRCAKLSSMQLVDRIGLAQAPMRVPQLIAATGPLIDNAHAAPGLLGSFADIRARLKDALGRRAADTVILVGAHPLEAEWCSIGRLAAFVPADQFFATPACG